MSSIVIDFNKFQDKLVPAIIQDVNTNKVLMLGYMNQEAFDAEAISRINSAVAQWMPFIDLEDFQSNIDNSENKLLPGMYTSVKVALPIIPNSIILPQTAITYTLYGDSAFIVTLLDKKTDKGDSLGTVKRVFVKTGEKRDNSVVILEGIKEGDLVVSSGQLKLVDGSKIAINNSVNL